MVAGYQTAANSLRESLAKRNGEAMDRKCALYCGLHICFFEVPSLKQRGLPAHFGERIREAVLEIQSGLVTALSEIRIGLPRGMRLLFRDRLDDDSGAPEKGVELPAPALSGLSFNHDRRFYEAGS
jgi:hypothetical protein